MSGVVPANSEDCSKVLNAVVEAIGSWRILTWIDGLAFMKRSTPLVRNDLDAGTPTEPAASGSFQIVMFVTLVLAPADAATKDAPEASAIARPVLTQRWPLGRARPSRSSADMNAPNSLSSDNQN